MSNNRIELLTNIIVDISHHAPPELRQTLIMNEIDKYINDNLFALNKLLKELRKTEENVLHRYKLKAKHEIIDQLLMYGFASTYSKIEGGLRLRELIEKEDNENGTGRSD